MPGFSSSSRRSTREPERWRAIGPDTEAMDRTNSVYILRNYIVEDAFTAALQGDSHVIEPPWTR